MLQIRCLALYALATSCTFTIHANINVFLTKPGRYDRRYGTFDDTERLEMLERTR